MLAEEGEEGRDGAARGRGARGRGAKQEERYADDEDEQLLFARPGVGLGWPQPRARLGPGPPDLVEVLGNGHRTAREAAPRPAGLLNSSATPSLATLSPAAPPAAPAGGAPAVNHRESPEPQRDQAPAQAAWALEDYNTMVMLRMKLRQTIINARLHQQTRHTASLLPATHSSHARASIADVARDLATLEVRCFPPSLSPWASLQSPTCRALPTFPQAYAAFEPGRVATDPAVRSVGAPL
jgi:hypothetical protein